MSKPLVSLLDATANPDPMVGLVLTGRGARMVSRSQAVPVRGVRKAIGHLAMAAQCPMVLVRTASVAARGFWECSTRTGTVGCHATRLLS